MSWPNLFIVGAMKAGTTALHAYLDQHPDIFMCDPKEPSYFSKSSPDQQDTERYLALFKAGAGCRYRGESSTQYTKHPTVTNAPARLADACPEARIIYMIREPVARIVSQYLFNRRVHGETRPLREAVAADPRYRDYGDYAAQIRPYQKRFGPVMVLQAEDLAKAPQAIMDRVCNGLDLPTIRVEQGEQRNRTADALRRHDVATRVLIRPELEPLRRVVKAVGAKQLVQSLWDRFNPPAPMPVTDAERAGLERDLADWRAEQAHAIAPLLDGRPLAWNTNV
ncbi:sulfotransferase [Roseibaca sp. V10]|uniref:Sulfotransferase n=1 Tax=Roseinatronobacter domitianus TaxID=2940293 RepID=A0ABT0M4C6_9RHOB|nr:sulfotransferase [Roseibaca domitiana]MCL1629149.1 sulfotransferase [Roseibaca domitiana]